MTLEPLLGDFRKLKRRTRDGWQLTYVDQFVDDLLVKSRVCATTLPKINPRLFLEDEDTLEPRVRGLGAELEELDTDGEDGNDEDRDMDGEGNENGEVNGNRNGYGDSGAEDERSASDSDG